MECQKQFRLKSSLERHRRVIHNEGETYQCPECDARCPDKGTLARHMYTHTGTFVLVFYLLLNIIYLLSSNRYVTVVYVSRFSDHRRLDHGLGDKGCAPAKGDEGRPVVLKQWMH